MLFDVSAELLANKSHAFPLLSNAALWIYFREEMRARYRWIQGTFSPPGRIAEESAESGSQAGLQSTPPRTCACYCYGVWNPEDVKT
jgi:hypothetical protein